MILLYSNQSDQLTRAILNNDALKKKITPLSIQSFINDCHIYDTIIDQDVNVFWKIGKKLEITNHSGQKIINRVIGISDDLFNDFHEEDREYAKSEYIAYLNFSLHQFKNVIGKPGQYGILGNQYPLNVQWEIARSKGYAVPNYFWGDHQYIPQLNTVNLVATQSLTQYYNWKTNYTLQTYLENDEWLFYEKPVGIPVLVYGFLGHHYHEYPSISQQLSLHEISSLYRESEKIAYDFGNTLYEMLLFYEPQTTKINFGMINSLFSGVRDFEAFKNFVTKAIQLEETL